MIESQNEILIQVHETPNPYAWKFILNKPVLLEGKATFNKADDAVGYILAQEILKIPMVTQVHLFANVITVSHDESLQDLESFKANIVSVIHTRYVMHNPAMTQKDSLAERRKDLPIEVQEIESILDRTIRPGLQGDGGDLEILRYEGDQLYVRYQGACGTCPSSTEGTLMAIEGILKDEFNPNIQVIPL